MHGSKLTAHQTRSKRERHGMTGSPEHVAWGNILKRCLNKNTPNYYAYGGKGITVCQEWIDSFSAFFREIGRRPSPNHSVDRIDNSRGYEPGNVRWATRMQQQSNMSSNVFFTHNGETHHLLAWSRISGVSNSVIKSRTRRGLPPDEVLKPVVHRPQHLRGVYYIKKHNNWQARFCVTRNELYHVGTFSTCEEAINALEKYKSDRQKQSA